MTDQEIVEQDVYLHPIPVDIQNYADFFVKPRYVKNTVIQTYIIDPTAAGNIGQKSVQISDYEPNRSRLVVQVLDQPVIITKTQPVNSPEASVAAGPAPSGRVLPNATAFEYCFYGPDAFWLNAVTGSTVGRVTVTKEYC